MATGTPTSTDEFEDLDWNLLDEEDDAVPESPAEADEGPADAQAPESEGAGEEAAQPAADAAPDDTPEGESPESATPEPEAPEPERTPFGFKADGKQVDVPGAETLSYPDGRRFHVIPEDSFNRVVRHHLADRNQFRQRELAYEQRLAEMTAASDPQNNATVQAASKAMQFVEALLAEPMESDSNAAEKVLLELIKLKEQYPVWKAQQERDGEKQRADAILAARDNVRLEPDEYEREQQQVHVDTALHQGMSQFLTSTLTNEAFKGLPQAELDDVIAEAWENRQRYVHVANEDVPEVGIAKGQPYYDFRPMLASLERAANRAQRYRSEVEGVKKQFQPRMQEVAKVAQQNAAALKTNKPTAGAARPKGERTSGEPKKNGTPKWEDFHDTFMATDLLADDN